VIYAVKARSIAGKTVPSPAHIQNHPSPIINHQSLPMRRSFLFFLLLAATAAAAPTKIACIGDSITFGLFTDKACDYPAQLQRMLGADQYLVGNFGVSRTTVLRKGDFPYSKKKALQDAVDFKPDIVVIMLGTNDTKPYNWGPYGSQFDADYRWLVSRFATTNIFVCRPCWVAKSDPAAINEQGIQAEIPIIDKIATGHHLKEIDMHAALEGHPEDYHDGVHPTTAGATILAKTVYKAITGSDYHGTVPPPAP